jgi:hypothetical protein
MGIVGVTTLHPEGPGDPELPTAPEVAPPSLDESSRAVCKDGDPLCTIPTKMVPESPSTGERLRRPRRSAVNSRLPKQMVSPGARPMSDRLLPLAMKESLGEITIGTSRGKAYYKSPYLARQLSVFLPSTRYMKVNIMCSYFEVVLQTIKHTMIYPGSCPSLEVIALHLVVWYYR